MEALRFSLKRAEIPVILETEDGTEKEYTLREMLGKDRDSYLNKMGSKLKMDSKGRVVGIKNYDGHMAILLIRCLFDEEDKLVTIDDVQKFPTKTQSDLFKAAQELNALNLEEEDEDSKNDYGESD